MATRVQGNIFKPPLYCPTDGPKHECIQFTLIYDKEKP